MASHEGRRELTSRTAKRNTFTVDSATTDVLISLPTRSRSAFRHFESIGTRLGILQLTPAKAKLTRVRESLDTPKVRRTSCLARHQPNLPSVEDVQDFLQRRLQGPL